MGKVIANFTNGFPGTISRSVDDVVPSFANVDTEAIEFGAPVFFDADGTGVTNIKNTSTAAGLVGFAVRAASKTPENYGSNDAHYEVGEHVDVLTRGSIILKASGTGIKMGLPCYLVIADGTVSASAGESGTTLALTNCHFRGEVDANNCVEVVVNDRNVI